MSGPGVTLLDGGMGRQLARMGAPFRQPEWSALALIEAPETVRAAHAAFIAAGAEVITTNSYAVVPFHIGEDRFSAQGLALADLSGRLARRAAASAATPVRVAGSLPPLFGSYRPDLFEPARAPEIAGVLVEGLAPHVDLWLAETQSSIREVAAAAAAVAGHGKPLWISCTIEDERPDPGAPRLRSGEPVEDAVRAALEMREAVDQLNRDRPQRDFILKIGVHRGASIAVTLNERLDYFGQSVNIAARVQNLADGDEICMTEEVYGAPDVAGIVAPYELTKIQAELKGVSKPMSIYRLARTAS